MPRTPRKPSARKKSAKKAPAILSATEILTSLPDVSSRAGMPAIDSITGIQVMTTPAPSGAPTAAAAPAGATYRIIKTNEIDAYEAAATAQETLGAPMAAMAAPTGDKFKGTARKAAKLSIANADTEKFQDVRTLVNSLTPDVEMINHVPKIKTTSTSNRVKEEKRNIRVRAFIYAASREDDNDFHLIIGRNPTKTPEVYMTMELSGLPPNNSSSFAKLNAARDAYKNFFAADLPGLTYDFYDPPIPVTVEGSLFFDASHSSGSRPGPKSLKSRMPTVWEVHPITKITFPT
ncbi:MAG: hypothetical protein ACR2LM_18710 [Pyrinomonadaceae bacterium]